MNPADVLASSPLGRPESLPLRPPDALDRFGRTLVVAPHPDDESLGCGGAIALLRARGHSVHVLFVSDGTLSHPSSRQYPAPRLAALREEEALAALAALGVEQEAAMFLRLKDRAVPLLGATGFDAAVDRCRALIDDIGPQTILSPWRRDPHPDHRASWSLIAAALARDPAHEVRRVEYPIWLWELAVAGDAPRPDEVTSWRLDIASVLPHKLRAIAAHRSQTTDLIDDDPTGFRLTPDILSHFAHSWEVYLESNACD
jgi:LmbE family N-acetylglucosaminyl deacetylase